MEALDVIESRIDSLNRLLGPLQDPESRNDSLIDSLVSANSLITSSMSGREKILEAAKRTNELEKYLDPNFLDEHQDVKAKEVYINTVAPELAGGFEMLENIKKLESTLGAEYFCNIPDVTDKLQAMNEAATDQTFKVEALEVAIVEAMKKYGEMQNNITEALLSMNERLDKLEEKLTKRKVDKDIE